MNKITLVFEMSYKKLGKGIALCVLTCCLAWPTAATAQEVVVSGRIIDSGRAVDFSGLSVILGDGQEVLDAKVIDSRGRFFLKAPKPGDYFVTLQPSLIAQSDTIWLRSLSSDVSDLVLRIFPADRQLDEITVSANRVMSSSGVELYFPTPEMREMSTDAYDLLSRLSLPEMQFDLARKKLTSLRPGTVQIRIDGIKSTLEDLSALHPGEVTRVDYVRQPGLAYGENISAVLIIRTNRKVDSFATGASVSHSLNQVIGNGSVYLRLLRKKHLLSIAVTESHDRGTGLYRDETNVYRFDTPLTLHLIGDKQRENHFSGSITATYGYSRDTWFLNGYLKYNGSVTPGKTVLNQVYSDDKLYYSDQTVVKDRTHHLSADLYFDSKDNLERHFYYNLHGTYILTDYDRLYSKAFATGVGMAPFGTGYHVVGRHYSLIGEGAYSFPLSSQLKLSVGNRTFYSRTNNDYTTDGILLPSKMDYFTSNVYAEADGSLFRLGYRLGIGGTFYALSSGETRHRTGYFTPSVSLRYSFTEPLSLSYDLALNTVSPSLTALSDFDQRLNEYEVNRGNSNLKAYHALLNNLTLSYWTPRQSLSAGIYYQYNYRPVMSDPVLYDRENEVMVFSSRNQGTFRHLQLRLNGSRKFFNDALTVTLFGVMNRHFTINDQYRHILTSYLYGCYLRFENGKWGSSLNYTSPIVFAAGEKVTTQAPELSLSAYYNFERWRIQLSVANPFMGNLYRNRSELESRYLSSSQTNYNLSANNCIRLTLTYTLQKGKMSQPRNQVTNSDATSGVVK